MEPCTREFNTTFFYYPTFRILKVRFNDGHAEKKETKSQSRVKPGLEPGPVVPNSLSLTTTLPHRPAKNSEKKLGIKFTNKLPS